MQRNFDSLVSVTRRCATEAFGTTCAVHVEDCGGWWLSGCFGSMAEHWQVSWVRFPAAASLFTFLFFRLVTIFLIRVRLDLHNIIYLPLLWSLSFTEREVFIPSFLTSPECLQPSMRDVAISAMKSHIVRHTDRVVQRLQLASALHEEWKANTWLESAYD